MVGRIVIALVAMLLAPQWPTAVAGDSEGEPGLSSPRASSESPRPAGEPGISLLPGNWRQRARVLETSARFNLADHGIDVDLVTRSEAFSNRRGGLALNDDAKHRGLVDLILTIDTQRAGMWTGGTLLVTAQHGYGTGVCDRYVGDLQGLSNIDGRDFTQISEIWFQQSLAADRLRLKAGRQDANIDFVTTRFGSDFINSSFGLIPTVPAPTFPDPAPGFAAFLDLSNRVALATGIYAGERGTFSIMEFALGSAGRTGSRAGSYRFGVWHQDGDPGPITESAFPSEFSGNYGAYLTFDQVLLQRSHRTARGLGLFLQLGVTPQDRNEIAGYAGGGLSVAGLIRGREDDVAGIGVAHAQLSDRVREIDGRKNETAIELFYRVKLAPWLGLQPDLQYIINPGGDGENALAVGLRLDLSF